MAIKTSLSSGVPYTGSVFFDGSGDYLSVPVSSSLDLTSGDFTVECWIYRTVGSVADQYILSQRTGEPVSQGWELRTNNTNICQFFFTGGSSISSISTIPVNVWTYIAVTRSSNTTRMFINGTLDSSAIFSNGTPAPSTSTFIGYGSSVGSNYFTGYISNLRIVKGRALYLDNFTPPTSPLQAIAGTSILACQTALTKDNSSNNFTITANGNASYSTLSPSFNIPTLTLSDVGSAYFDGTGDYLSLPSDAAYTLGTAAFSLEVWFYPTGNANENEGGIASGMIDNNGTYAPAIYHTNTGNINVYIRNSSSLIFGTSVAINLNRWNHIVLCRDGSSNAAVFLNGNRITSGTNTTNISTTFFTVGRTYTNLTNFNAKGYISNIRLVKGSTPYDPTNTSLTVPTVPLTAIANTSLLTCQGPTLRDASSNNFAITLNGNAKYADPSPFTPILREANTVDTGSTYFDGAGDFLSAPANAAWAFGTGDFTVELWAYHLSTTGYRITNRLASPTPGAAAGTWSLGIQPAGGFSFTEVVGGEPGVNVSISSALGTWHHYAVSRQSNTLRMFFNGVLVGSGTVSTNFNNTSYSLLIGSSPEAQINGYISNLRIVKGTAVYTSNFTPQKLLDLVPNTQLLLRSVNSSLWLTDDSPNNFTITASGNAKYSVLSPDTPSNSNSSSVYFNGNGGNLSFASSGNAINFTGAYTIECWFNLYSNLTYLGSFSYYLGRIIAGLTSASGGIEISIISTNSSTTVPSGIIVATYASGSPTAMSATGLTIPLGTWHHLAVVRNSSNVTSIFLNGTRVATSTISGSYASQNVNIGGASSGVSYYGWLPGYISNLRVVKDVAVYDPALSSLTVPTAPLTAIANTSLLTCQGSTVKDNSINNFSLSTTGNVFEWNQSSPFNIVNYSVNQNGIIAKEIDEVTLESGSLYFDGSGDYLSIPYSLNFDLSSVNFTIELWFNSNSFATVSSLLAKDTYGLNYDWGLQINNATTIIIYTLGTSSSLIVTVPTMLVGTWYHIALVRNNNANTTSLYLNGISYGSNGMGFTNASQSFLTIGCNGWNSPSQFFNGYISNLCITKGTALYTGNFTPNRKLLESTLNTSLLLNCIRNQEFKDSSTNNFSITKNGNVSFAQFSPFYQHFSNSVYFDGNGDYLTIPTSSNFGFGTGDFTVECWIYLLANAVSAGTTILDFRSGVTITPWTWYITNTGSGNWLGAYTSFGVSQSVEARATAIALNTWTHVAISRATGTWRLFVNGISQTLTGSSYDGNLGSTNQLTIAAAAGGGIAYLNGYISNLRILKGTALYTNNFTPSRQPLTAITNTSLLTCQDFTIRDNSANNLSIVTNGNAAVDNFNPFGNVAQKQMSDGTLMVRQFSEVID